MKPGLDLPSELRQMIAVLEYERQALADLDLDALVIASNDKSALCDRLEGQGPEGLDDECRGLLRAARQLNEVNRRVRNLLAANVAARLNALTGDVEAYRAVYAARV